MGGGPRPDSTGERGVVLTPAPMIRRRIALNLGLIGGLVFLPAILLCALAIEQGLDRPRDWLGLIGFATYGGLGVWVLAVSPFAYEFPDDPSVVVARTLLFRRTVGEYGGRICPVLIGAESFRTITPETTELARRIERDASARRAVRRLRPRNCPVAEAEGPDACDTRGRPLARVSPGLRRQRDRDRAAPGERDEAPGA